MGTVGLALVLLVVAARAGAATGPDASGYEASQDPLDGILHRLDRTFHIDETSGITLDVRYPLNPSETVRLSIVAQLLAYNELYKVRRTAVYRQDVVARADYLVDNFDSVLSNSAFDGMLGYSLLGAYEITHDERYFDKAATIVASNMQLYGFNITLNWGLMAAMGFAKYAALTGDSAVAQKAHDVIASLLYYQHRDGSFAHYCPSSTDIHYTGWMSMELITIAKCFDDPNIAPILAGTTQFLLGRVDSLGVTHYADACSTCVNGAKSYYSIATGCTQDYDTRGWINELGYTAMLFDQQKQPRYGDVMRFLRSLENNGTFPDKWDYMPPTSDPIYPWAVGDPSIIRMSVLFWSLACIYAERNADLPADDPRDSLPSYPVIAAKTPGVPTAAARICAEDACANGADFVYSESWLWSRASATRASLAPRIDRTAASGLTLALAPTNGRRAVEARFVLPQDAEARLSVFDVSGRRVRTLSLGRLAAGEHRLTWDGRDAAGRTGPSGVYLVRLESGAMVRVGKAIIAP